MQSCRFLLRSRVAFRMSPFVHMMMVHTPFHSATRRNSLDDLNIFIHLSTPPMDLFYSLHSSPSPLTSLSQNPPLTPIGGGDGSDGRGYRRIMAENLKIDA